MKRTALIYTFLGCAILQSCSVSRPFYGEKEKDWDEKKMPSTPVKYTVYLLGDPGDDTANTALKMIGNEIPAEDTSHATVIFGNAFKKGKHQKKNKSTAKENIIQPEFYTKDRGKIVFIPDPDHASSTAEVLKDQSAGFSENKNIFIHDPGCNDVKEFPLSEEVLILPIQSYFGEKGKAKKGKCAIDNLNELVEEIIDVVDNNQRKNILLAGYFPLLNLGNRGGHFSWKQHLFPLTDLNKNLFIPLPVAGSLYYLFKFGLGSPKDQTYPAYKKFRRSLAKAMIGFNNLTHASGLEHNLQYFKYNNHDFIVTNSSGKSSWVGKNNRAGLTYAGSGYVKMLYMKNGETWMEVIVPDDQKPSGRVIFRKQLKENFYSDPGDSTWITSSDELKDSSVVMAADESLEAGKVKTFFFGKHYRQAWITPVKTPVLDLRTEKGGLKIIKKGGGFQTKSLQLENPKGEEYSLRSVSKYPERLLGPNMANTLAADVVKDQVSSSHPYSPYVVDDLSHAADVLHSHPKMVFIPNDKLLGEFRKDFANTLALFEQRADGNIRPAENFGYARETSNSKKMLNKLHKDNANTVDDHTFLRSRLFDMWINDWDRHEDQWRWGEIECKDSNDVQCRNLKAKEIYFVPIPKDRDQAFARFDGVIPWLAGRKWAVRKFQDFQHDIRDVPGLNFNARNIDHALLTELSRADWMQIAQDLQTELSDAKIERSIKKLPDTIYKIDGAFITERLKSRRDKLPSIAMRYYDYLAKDVDITGSDKEEFFKVTRINDDSTSVVVYDYRDGKTDRVIYSRTFLTNETDEVRLYAMGGNDHIRVAGQVKKSILIRIIGGEGTDTIIDESKVSGLSKKTKVYDNKEKNTLVRGSETRDLRSESESVNEYDYHANDYNVVAPATFFGYNRDDGIFLGGGIMIRSNSFRKAPYANYQRIVANVALTNLSTNFRYMGDFNHVIGKWGINVEVALNAPNGTTNFFGYGNDTRRMSASDDYYRYRYDQLMLFPALKKRMGNHHALKGGPVYEFVKARNEDGRFISSTEGLPFIQDNSGHHYAGGKLVYEFRHIDDSVLTLRGIQWVMGVTSRYDVGETSSASTNLESELCVYIPVGNRSTLAMRAGGGHAIGDFEVYHANTLGGQDIQREPGNLRGYLRDRYSGRSSAYLNTDLRVKLFSFRTYLFPAHFGLLGFYDMGRVWTDHENSTTWHNGYGGGIWIDPFGKAIINLSYALSKEEKLFTVGIGFLF